MKRKQPSRIRHTSSARTLTEKNADKNPFVQFRRWFDAAQNRRVPQPEAVALATSSRDGLPTVRMVLLKGVDDRGFSFYTNFESRKGRQLAENPRAALLFFWPQLERQIRIEGKIEKLSREESMAYFSSRPRKSRIGAWASRQSEIIDGRGPLELSVKEFERKFHGKEVPLPDYWGGFRVVAEQFEFWQGRPNRLHDRLVYRKAGVQWEIVRLSP